VNYTTIASERKGAVGILYLNRPEVLNAFSADMDRELFHFLQGARSDDSLRVLILTGKGRAFSAGGDLNMFKEDYEAYQRNRTESRVGGTELPRVFIDFPKPLIAAINGAAFGFGLTVSLTCDIRIAVESAVFSCAFARIGVTPEFGSSYLLPKVVGYARAAELAFTAKDIDAREAYRIGLVNRVVPSEELMAASEALANEIAALPKEAIMMAKRILRHGSQSTLEQSLPYESLVFQYCTRTAEHYQTVCETIARLKGAKSK
jgi:2-(1,2-epoxy-1,2-dihydrophenyl)acetyl-CoA isomerase